MITCKDCIYFKLYENNNYFGYCISNESRMKSKYLRSKLSQKCKAIKRKK